MSTTTRVASRKRPPSAALRHTGYAGTVVFDVVSLVAINGWPGRDVLPSSPPAPTG